MASPIISRNIIHLLRIMITTHQTHDSFCENLGRLIKHVIKDMLAYEKNIQVKLTTKDAQPLSELEKSSVAIKRTIGFNLVKSIKEISNEYFKKDLAEAMFKFHQTHKLDNNANNHPVLKTFFKIFGFANSKVNNPIGYENKSKNLLQQKDNK